MKYPSTPQGSHQRLVSYYDERGKGDDDANTSDVFDTTTLIESPGGTRTKCTCIDHSQFHDVDDGKTFSFFQKLASWLSG